MRARKPVGLFVSGTDTGVGKTVIACALAMWCRKQKINVGVMKPVATGGCWVMQGNRRCLVSDDARLLRQAAGSSDSWELVNPVCFEEPLAPWTSALRAHKPISLSRVEKAYRTLSRRHDVVIVEGVGGLLVPLNRTTVIADVAKHLHLAVLLVSRPGLGTLNHTLLSLAYLQGKKLRCRGVIVNAHGRRPKDPSARLACETNPKILKRLGPPLLGCFPFHDNWLRRGQINPRLGSWLEDALGRRILLSLVKG